MRLDRLLSLVTVLAVLVTGVVYVQARPRSWASDAQVVLVPAKVGAGEASPLDSFTSGGTLGTTVELLASPDLAAQVPQRGVTFTARAVADTRVIALHASGPQDVVRSALATLLSKAGQAQARLADRWTIVALTRPTAAAPAGPTAPALLVATALLALLAGVGALVAVRRLLPAAAGRRVPVHLPHPRAIARVRVRAAAAGRPAASGAGDAGERDR